MHRFSGLELKKITFNTFFQLIVRITSSTSTLVATLLIGYFSGFNTLGSFTKIVSFVSLFYLIIDFGFNQIFLKLYFDKAKKYLGNLFLLRILFSFIAVFVTIFIAYLLPYNSILHTGYSDSEKYGILLYSLSIITTGIFLSTQVLLQKKLTYKLSLLPSFISSIILIILVIFSVRQNSLYFLLLSFLVSSIVLASLMFISILRKYEISLSLFKFQSFSKAIFLASLPIGLMLFFNLLYSKVDIILLSIFKSNLDVGVYGVSYRFFELSIAVPAFLSNSTYPLLLKESKNSKKYLSLFKKYFSLFLLLSLISTLLLFFCAPLIGFLKHDFALSVKPLQILSLSLPFFFLTSLLQWHFVIESKTRFLVPLYAGALILNVILNLLFIPRFSYFASAFATSFCEGLVFIVMLWYFKREKTL